MGQLQVKTQREVVNDGGFLYTSYTSYSVYDAAGRRVRTVLNRAGHTDQRAMIIALPSGRYRVVARAEGYGMVTVPVVISALTLTEVCLERGGLPGTETAAASEVVRLPEGPVVGWRAKTSETDPENGSAP